MPVEYRTYGIHVVERTAAFQHPEIGISGYSEIHVRLTVHHTAVEPSVAVCIIVHIGSEYRLHHLIAPCHYAITEETSSSHNIIIGMEQDVGMIHRGYACHPIALQCGAIHCVAGIESPTQLHKMRL